MNLGIIRLTIAAHKLIGEIGGNQLPLSKMANHFITIPTPLSAIFAATAVVDEMDPASGLMR